MLALRQTTRTGKVLGCGKSAGAPCRVRKTATLYLAGAATPVPIPAASRAVALTFFHREGGTWRRVRTSTVRTTSTTGSWRTAVRRVTSAKGQWRVQARTGGLPTLTAGTSGYSYYKVV